MSLNTAQQVGAILGVIVAAIAAFEGIRRAIVMPVARIAKKFIQMLTDWVGEEDRPGVQGRAGVMEQLASLRDELAIVKSEQAEMKGKLARVEYHTGNGHEPALRKIVEAQGEELQKIKDQVTPSTRKRP